MDANFGIEAIKKVAATQQFEKLQEVEKTQDEFLRKASLVFTALEESSSMDAYRQVITQFRDGDIGRIFSVSDDDCNFHAQPELMKCEQAWSAILDKIHHAGVQRCNEPIKNITALPQILSLKVLFTEPMKVDHGKDVVAAVAGMLESTKVCILETTPDQISNLKDHAACLYELLAHISPADLLRLGDLASGISPHGIALLPHLFVLVHQLLRLDATRKDGNFGDEGDSANLSGKLDQFEAYATLSMKQIQEVSQVVRISLATHPPSKEKETLQKTFDLMGNNEAVTAPLAEICTSMVAAHEQQASMFCLDYVLL